MITKAWIIFECKLTFGPHFNNIYIDLPFLSLTVIILGISLGHFKSVSVGCLRCIDLHDSKIVRPT